MMKIFCAAWLSLLAALLIPVNARANCSGTTSKVTFNPPSTINVPFNAPVGTVLWTSSPVSPNVTYDMTCNNNTASGIKNVIGTTPGTATTVFPTNVAGVGYTIMHPDNTLLLPPYPFGTQASGTYQMSVASTLQLVTTGPITSGSTIPATTLGNWFFANNLTAEKFVLGNSVTFTVSACSVNTTPINVALPTLAASSLGSVGDTGGRTPFNISLTCASGATLSIQFNYNGSNTGITGALSNTGTAKGVDVQLLDQNFAPLSFGTTTTLGATPDGTWNIPYYAQYYRAGTVSAGSVSASATFTLSYQ